MKRRTFLRHAAAALVLLPTVPRRLFAPPAPATGLVVPFEMEDAPWW